MRSVAASLLAVAMVAGLAACSPTPPRLWVRSVQLTPEGGREPVAASSGQEPFILPSGVAGTIDVFFAANIDTLTQCTLALDGIHSFTPIVLSTTLSESRMLVRIPTRGLSADRLTKGSLDCTGTDSFGSQKAGDDFSVATKLVIVSFVNTGQVDFPTTQVGSTSPDEAVLLGNLGTLVVDVMSVRITGAGAGNYRFADEPCSGVTLGKNDSCEVKVVFAPQSAGEASATLEVQLTSADPKNPDTVTEIVLLRGTGTPAPTPTPTPPPQDQPHQPPTG